MTNSLIDISGKLETDIVACIEWVATVCTSMGLDVLLVGALARDIHFFHCHRIPTGRATMDIDFAVLTPDWGTFEEMKVRMLENPNYTRDISQLQRLRTNTGLLMDLIPFGGIETSPGVIHWPPSFTQIMSTIGFQDALSTSMTCRVRSTPELDIRIVSIAGIAALKLISWADSYAERKKDALDFHFILTHYLDAGQSERLWITESDLMDVPDFDYELTGARMLGRDVARMARPETLHRILDILAEELRPGRRHRLIAQWDSHANAEEATAYSFLESFMKGIAETSDPRTE